jgi:hypothetical protein
MMVVWSIYRDKPQQHFKRLKISSRERRSITKQVTADATNIERMDGAHEAEGSQHTSPESSPHKLSIDNLNHQTRKAHAE